MKPSKKNRARRGKRSTLATVPAQGLLVPPNAGEGAVVREEEDDGEEKDEIRDLDWLTEAFASASLEQISYAYLEAGRDVFKASGILGSHLDGVPQEASERKAPAARRWRRMGSVSSGMVTDVIGKGYSRSAVVAQGRSKRRWEEEAKGYEKQRYSVEEAEEFLLSMLGDHDELGMGVVRDVLGHCGNDVEKALNILLVLSTSIRGVSTMDTITSFQVADKMLDFRHKLASVEFDSICPVGNGDSDGVKSLTGIVSESFSTQELASHLPQKVLESFFKFPESSKNEVSQMNWLEVVKEVEMFGQGLEFNRSGEGSSPRVEYGKDPYHIFRNPALKHWHSMRKYYQQASAAYANGQRAQVAYLSEQGKRLHRLAREADDKAAVRSSVQEIRRLKIRLLLICTDNMLPVPCGF